MQQMQGNQYHCTRRAWASLRPAEFCMHEPHLNRMMNSPAAVWSYWYINPELTVCDRLCQTEAWVRFVISRSEPSGALRYLVESSRPCSRAACWICMQFGIATALLGSADGIGGRDVQARDSCEPADKALYDRIGGWQFSLPSRYQMRLHLLLDSSGNTSFNSSFCEIWGLGPGSWTWCTCACLPSASFVEHVQDIMGNGVRLPVL